MSASDIDFNENDGLIKEKFVSFEPLHKSKRKQSVYTYECTFSCVHKLWTCFVMLFLVFICAILVGAVVWYYVEERLPRFPIHPMNDGDIPDFAIDISVLPNSTVSILLNHVDGQPITDEERDILQSMFDLFDAGGDDLWDKEEFENFIDTVIEPENRFKDMDFDANGIVTLAELTLYLASYYKIDMYKCDRTSQIIEEIFKCRYRNEVLGADMEYFEYMSHLWFKQLVPNNMDFITQENYVKYIEDEEWQYHDKNGNARIEFKEFLDSFFDSVYYSSYKKYVAIADSDPELLQAIEDHLETIDAKTVSAFKPRFSVHKFDKVISLYIDGRPSESILYQLPHIYTATIFKRRLKEGSFNCFSENGITAESDGIHKRLKDISAGDYVFDGDVYTKVVYVKRGVNKVKMIELELISAINSNKTSITLTGDHLLYDIDMNLVRTDDVQIGDHLSNDYVVYNINYHPYEAHSTPVTMSGKIQVDNVTASCYTHNTRFAERAHDMMAAFRFISRYISDTLAEKFLIFALDDVMHVVDYCRTIYGLNGLDFHWIMDYIFSVYFVSVCALKVCIQLIF